MTNSTIRWILIVLIVVAGAYLVIDHGQHIAPYLPLAFLLGCLVMHLFMHGSHGGHDHGSSDHEEHNH